MNDEKILVTGGTGFLGRHIYDTLRGHNLKPLLCARSGRSPFPLPASDYVQCDLLDAAAVTRLCATLRPSYLIHLAWGMDSSGAYWRSPDNLRWLFASQHLMQAFAQAGGHRFIGVGTCVEYSPVGEPRSESRTPTVPDTLYGKAKLACGNTLSVLADVFSFSAAWCRPFYLLGPGEPAHRLIPSACRALRAVENFHCTDGERIFDYLDIRDAAEAIVQLLLSDITGAVNIASGVGIRVRDLLDMLARVNNATSFVSCRAPQQKHPPVIAAVDRLHGVLGFTPRFCMEQSLRDCYSFNQ